MKTEEIKQASKKKSRIKGAIVAMIALLGAGCFMFAGCGTGSTTGDGSSQSSQTTESSFESNNDQNDENSSVDKVEAVYSFSTYSTTAEYGNAGTYTELSAKEVKKGDKVTLTATVNEGYNFVGWYVGQYCLSQNLEYIFTVQEEDVSVEARFSSYTLTVQSSSNKYAQAGEYSQFTNKKVSVGEKVNLTASVKDGYNFDGWFIGEICVCEDLEYAYTMKEENTVIEAVYSYYTVTTGSDSADGGKAGTYTQYTAQKISDGQSVTLTATVNKGYNFEGWYAFDGWNEELITKEFAYTFEMGKENLHIKAQYSYYTLTTFSGSSDSGYAGTYTEYTGEKISVGEEITLTATVNEGYNFEGWYVNKSWYLTPECLGTDLTYTFTMTAENTEIEACYSYYTVSTWSESDDYGLAGEYTKYTEEKISVGEEVMLTATVNDGYNFVGWYVNDTCVETNTAYKFTMTAESIWIKACYNYYTVTTSVDSDDNGLAGTYTEYTDEKISVGEEVTLTATVNDGYNFVGWYINETCVETDTTYKFTMTAEYIWIVARYSYYTVTTWSDSNEYGLAGTYTEYSEEKISLGEEVVLTATVEDGYNFEGWYRDGICMEDDLTYAFVMEGDVYVEARYSYYTLETNAYRWYWNYTTSEFHSIMGSYDNYDQEKIKAGTKITLTATVNSGYIFLGWYINGTKVSEGFTYTFTMPKQNVEVDARFDVIE